MRHHLIKTLCYRVLSSTQGTVIAWLLTGSLTLATTFGAILLITNSALYLAFEFAWSAWGRLLIPTAREVTEYFRDGGTL